MQAQWWDKPLRVIQYNLQVGDTGKIKAAEMIADLKSMYANTLVINVGGIYAWYPSRVKYHHINEFLPDEYDLLGEIIERCHYEGIKVIARFDFSKAEDKVFLEKPKWFVQKEDGSPLIYGIGRPGDWSLLMSTCINSGYRDKAFAFPVIREVMEQYDIDGIFFNAPQMETCYCENCKRKYRLIYGKDMEEDYPDREADWRSKCLFDNMLSLYRYIKSLNSDLLVVQYFQASQPTVKAEESDVVNVDVPLKTADLLCMEAQNVLSAGRQNLQPFYKPAGNMRAAAIPDHAPIPFGIIHSSPGMDWRHSGMPVAEYRFWLSMIPASNANLWHSLTGTNETIRDKRIIRTVREVNQRVAAIERYMYGAELKADVLLIWDGEACGLAWQEIFVTENIQYDLCDAAQLNVNRLLRYKVAVVPGDFRLTTGIVSVLDQYIELGGHVLFETCDVKNFELIREYFRVAADFTKSADLQASYILPRKNDLGQNPESTSLLPFAGKTLYLTALEDADVLLTLVPPFAPSDAVGAPPERATILCLETDIPLCLASGKEGQKVMCLPFHLSEMAIYYGLADHYQLVTNLLRYLCSDSIRLTSNAPRGTYISLYENKAGDYLVHIVNGVGERPLHQNIMLYEIEIEIKLARRREVNLAEAMFGAGVSHVIRGTKLLLKIERVDYWELVRVQFSG